MATTDQRFRVFRICLMQQGLKLTRQRQEIAEAVFSEQRHFSAEELVDELQTKGSSAVSRASVYRTLQFLEQRRLVRAIEVRSSCRYYERAPIGPQEDHEHLVCTECGLIVDVPTAPLAEATTLLCAELEFRVTQRSAQVLGVCKACAANR